MTYAPTFSANGRSHYRPAKHNFAPDKIALVGYHDKAFVRAMPTEAYSGTIQERIQDLPNRIGGSGTNITDGLRKAVALLQNQPRGVLRRIWLLSDGYANRETDQLDTVLQSVRSAFTNINTIGFGDQYDEALLKRIAGATHHGQFLSIKSLRELTDSLIQHNVRRQGPRHHRPEVTVFSIDCSPSMKEAMEGSTKIAVVVEGMLRLLDYKQRLHS